MNRCLIVVLTLAALVSQLQAQAPAATTPGVVRTGNISPIIENLDKSLAFYETLLHLQVPPNRGGGPRPFMVNPGLHKMFGTTGATERHVDARIPGTSMGIEMIEFHDVDRRGARPRVQDPGQVAIVLLVRDVDALLSRLTAAGVPVRTPGGKPVPVRDGARSVLVDDPDGRPVELRQLASLPASAPADGDIVGGRLAVTVADLDKTVAVYRTALGFDVTPPTRFAVDPFIRTLTGVRGEVRRATATSPGTGQLFELTEFKGVERTPLQTRLQDPGSVRLQVMVRGINEVTAAITRARRGDPERRRRPRLAAAEPVGHHRPHARQRLHVAARAVRRLRAEPPDGGAARRGVGVERAAGAVDLGGGDRAGADVSGSGGQRRARLAAGGGLPVSHRGVLRHRHGQRRAVHDADPRAAAEGTVAVQRHRGGRSAPRRRPLAHLRVVARVDPDAPAPVRGDRAQPRQHRAAQDVQRRALRPARDRARADQRDPGAGRAAGEERGRAVCAATPCAR